MKERLRFKAYRMKRFAYASLLSHMIIVMLDETCLATKFLLTNPTGEAFNVAWVFFTQRNQHTRLFATSSYCGLWKMFSLF